MELSRAPSSSCPGAKQFEHSRAPAGSSRPHSTHRESGGKRIESGSDTFALHAVISSRLVLISTQPFRVRATGQ